MTRERFLADCAEAWDQSDDRAVLVFAVPGSQVQLAVAPMTLHSYGPWICARVGHLDDDSELAALQALLDAAPEASDGRQRH